MTPPPDRIHDLISELSVLTQVWGPKHRLVDALRAFSQARANLESVITQASLFIQSFEDPKGPIGDAFFVRAPSEGHIPRWNEMELAYMRQQVEAFCSTLRTLTPAAVTEIPGLIDALGERASPPVSEDLLHRARDVLLYFDEDLRKREAMVDCAERYIGLCGEQLGVSQHVEPRWDRKKLEAMRRLADQFSLARFGRVTRQW